MIILTAGVIALVWLYFQNLRMTYKISYYETKLENRWVDISKVKNMPWYKLTLD